MKEALNVRDAQEKCDKSIQYDRVPPPRPVLLHEKCTLQPHCVSCHYDRVPPARPVLPRKYNTPIVANSNGECRKQHVYENILLPPAHKCSVITTNGSDMEKEENTDELPKAKDLYVEMEKLLQEPGIEQLFGNVTPSEATTLEPGDYSKETPMVDDNKCKMCVCLAAYAVMLALVIAALVFRSYHSTAAYGVINNLSCATNLSLDEMEFLGLITSWSFLHVAQSRLREVHRNDPVLYDSVTNAERRLLIASIIIKCGLHFEEGFNINKFYSLEEYVNNISAYSQSIACCSQTLCKFKHELNKTLKKQYFRMPSNDTTHNRFLYIVKFFCEEYFFIVWKRSTILRKANNVNVTSDTEVESTLKYIFLVNFIEYVDFNKMCSKYCLYYFCLCMGY